MADYEFILGTEAERNKTKEMNHLSLDLNAIWPGMNFHHSEMAYWFERSRSVLDLTNYLIVSLSSEYRGLFAPCGGWGEEKMEVRGGRREGETSSIFPFPIVHLALSIFKLLPLLMETRREPLQRSELQYSFLLFC